ncbi:MAG: hypothetical protein HOP02_17110 [Methylococcaceae bacterium]|nr:hypothetical protein [Methylococcaceae bacterium]
MRRFKSVWFYWYTGHKNIALLSMLLNTLIMWLVLVLGAGLSIWGILIAVLLDALGFWMALIYLAIRHNLTGWWSLQEKVDQLFITQLLIPFLVSLVLSRVSSFLVAKCLGYKFVG